MDSEKTMKKLRWVMDREGFWDVDASTPRTVDGLARPVPGDTLPLGLSRGPRLSRPKQIDFFQCFMAAPFVPSYAGDHGFALQRVLTIPFAHNWYFTQFSILGFFSFKKNILLCCITFIHHFTHEGFFFFFFLVDSEVD